MGAMLIPTCVDDELLLAVGFTKYEVIPCDKESNKFQQKERQLVPNHLFSWNREDGPTEYSVSSILVEIVMFIDNMLSNCLWFYVR